MQVASRHPIKVPGLSWTTEVAGALLEDLRDIAHFIFSTSLRESEVWALRLCIQENPISGSVVFNLSETLRKNKRDLSVLCNGIAMQIVNKRRGNGSD